MSLFYLLESGRGRAPVLITISAVLMRGHGFTAVGANIPNLIIGAISLRNNALVLLNALQLGGKVNYVSSEEAGSNRASTVGTLGMERAWNAYVGRAKKEMPDVR